LSEKDIPSAFELLRAREGIGLRPEEGLEAFARFLARNPGLSHGAWELASGRLIGCAFAGHDGKRGHLYHVAVAAASRRRGLGRELCELCLAALEREGIRRSMISVFANNEPALKFWREAGWTLRDDLKTLTFLRTPR
jgi:ribosomal protein S18 acetylase RimI-like enzyme